MVERQSCSPKANTVPLGTGKEARVFKHVRLHDGQWLNDLPYGTIHKLAAGSKGKGIFQKCLDFCRSICDEIRVDTHKDNLIMQKLAERNGFVRCGIIYVDDGTPRIAYQLKKQDDGQE